MLKSELVAAAASLVAAAAVVSRGVAFTASLLPRLATGNQAGRLCSLSGQ